MIKKEGVDEGAGVGQEWTKIKRVAGEERERNKSETAAAAAHPPTWGLFILRRVNRHA